MTWTDGCGWEYDDVQHPNIISYVDMGQERDGTYYIVRLPAIP